MDSNLSANSINRTNNIEDEATARRSGGERREDSDRRRSSSGLFELRARREAPAGDRRGRRDRRDSLWARLAFWRRHKVDASPLT